MNRVQLLARAQELRSEMRRIDLLLQASITHRHLTCGKAGCKCTRGELHSAWSLTYKVKGTTRTIYLGEDMRQEALEWVSNWRRFRKLLRQHSALLTRALQVKKRR